MERSYQRDGKSWELEMSTKQLWVPEPVGLAEEVDRPEENLHFKHQFQMLPSALCPDLLAASGLEGLSAVPFQRVAARR